LLVDYVSHLQGGLERAENLVKAGELGQAIWAYLEVLEVDPDNPVARKQISQVVTAIRQFDTIMPGRRFAHGLPPQLPKTPMPWWYWLIIIGAVIAAFGIGLAAAHVEWEWPTLPPTKIDDLPKQPNNHMGGGAPAM
jgi:hypothetical protein